MAKRHELYATWDAMKQRCNNTNCKGYKYYGAKGITYDPKWESFKGFLEDIGNRSSTEYSLDRIDPKGNYTKDNCRWILKSENSSRAAYKHGLSGTKEYNKEYNKTNKDIIKGRKEKRIRELRMYLLNKSAHP